jgi:dihydroorotate dehydrogenase
MLYPKGISASEVFAIDHFKKLKNTMLSESIARLDHIVRPLAVHLPPPLATQMYSSGRNVFLSALTAEKPASVHIAEHHARTLWGLTFRNGLLNAAGMFKQGEGYETVWRQGAGGYLAGTTTAHKRTGNARNGITKPFAPYPRSRAASNWLGLPNDGHEAVAKRLAAFERKADFPIGASLMTAPESSGEEALRELVEGMEWYDKANVDFLEINESCPNVAHGASTLDAIAERLAYIGQRFLQKRSRNLPVVVKFSTDTASADVEPLLDILLASGYDGVNFGNTSTNYTKHRAMLHADDQELFDYFTQTFGGGISGEPLRTSSLELVRAASTYIASQKLAREFHIIRTGGVATVQDVEESFSAGASLCQWYTGYFERFAEDGHRLYGRMFG